MRCFKRYPQAALALFLMAAAIAGCCQDGHKACEDIPPGAIPQPNGTYLCQWNHAETGRANRENFVIYQYEWTADGTKLTETGRQHIADIAQCVSQGCSPVVIEPAPDQRVNDIRRAAVMEALANCRVNVAQDRIVLGRSEAEGLYGDEAAGIARGMFLNGASGGQAAGSFNGGGLGVSGGATGSAGGISGGIGGGGGSGIY